jgi:hypothetical protein
MGTIQACGDGTQFIQADDGGIHLQTGLWHPVESLCLSVGTRVEGTYVKSASCAFWSFKPVSK